MRNIINRLIKIKHCKYALRFNIINEISKVYYQDTLYSSVIVNDEIYELLDTEFEFVEKECPKYLK